MMRPEDVPTELAEKARVSMREDGAYSADVSLDWVARRALAAAMPLWAAAVLQDLLDRHLVMVVWPQSDYPIRAVPQAALLELRNAARKAAT